MQKIFNELIDSFIDNRVGIADNFLNGELSSHLRDNLVGLHSGNLLRSAGTGNAAVATHNKLFRSDIIHWLDRAHDDVHENDFFNLMDRFVLHLNTTCYTGITGYEFHYTLYEEGSFYKRHLDQFRNNESRKYSMIMYLNPGWQKDDGGELCIHHAHHSQRIDPVDGKTVFFKSNELEHEVLITHKERMSITGWLSGG